MAQPDPNQQLPKQWPALFAASFVCMLITFGSLEWVTDRLDGAVATTATVAQLAVIGALLLYIGRLVGTMLAETDAT